MIFGDFDPKEDKIFRIIDNEGVTVNDTLMPVIADETLIKAYKDMLFARTVDTMAVSYQRQGRMYTYPPNFGQEAVSVAAGLLMKDNDWLVPAFRELGAWLAKGVSLKEIFLYYMGYEEGNTFKNANHMLPFAVPISTQLPHATGIGYAINYLKKDEVVFTFVGDGGTSEGDFAEALNFAAVWKAPIVFTVQNNQYAISLPVKEQTKSINIAIKSYAYGIPGIKVDGNDFLAMYSVYEKAREYVKAGNGPVLIEAYTYRKGAHTTSDDPTKYRSKEEEAEWEKADPLLRMRKFLDKRNLWNEDENALIETFKNEIDRQFAEAENFPPYQLDDVFRFMYVDMPDDLKKQKSEYEKFLKWREERK